MFSAFAPNMFNFVCIYDRYGKVQYAEAKMADFIIFKSAIFASAYCIK